MHNKELITKRFEKNLKNYNKLAVVQQKIAAELAHRISQQEITPQKGIEIGSGTGFLTCKLTALYPACNWCAVDIVAKSSEFLPAIVSFQSGDAEHMILPDNQNIIASSSTVQWFDDLPKFIERALKTLASHGLIAFSTFGPDNLQEITATTGETLKYYTLEELKTMLPRNYTVLYASEWYETLQFNNPLEVLRHLKATGVNAIESTRWTKSQLKKFQDNYQQLYPTIPLTFHPQIIIARKDG